MCIPRTKKICQKNYQERIQKVLYFTIMTICLKERKNILYSSVLEQILSSCFKTLCSLHLQKTSKIKVTTSSKFIRFTCISWWLITFSQSHIKPIINKNIYCEVPFYVFLKKQYKTNITKYLSVFKNYACTYTVELFNSKESIILDLILLCLTFKIN